MFTATNIILVVGAVLLGVAFYQPRILKSRLWRATVTPLASIIGSGFLVSGPILSHAAGPYAWLAMLGLCAAAYLFGSAIRSNITQVEPLLKADGHVGVKGLERAADLVLALAYFISVAYYLNLFGAFGLRLIGVTDQLWIRVAATVTIAIVGAVGALGGLRALERLEVDAVSLKLAIIGGLVLALIAGAAFSAADGDFAWPKPEHPATAGDLRTIFGLLILVQGFETSRYLGAEYDAAERVRTMRWAQWISTGIYVVFILLVTPYFGGHLTPEGGETAIIDMLASIGPLLAPAIILTALASQSSAAIADTNGAGGLLSGATHQRLSVKGGNLATAVAAIVITWVANIYEIIAYASKAFVLYYGLQAVQAALSAWKSGRPGLAAVYAAGVVLAAAIVVFAIPAEA